MRWQRSGIKLCSKAGIFSKNWLVLNFTSLSLYSRNFSVQGFTNVGFFFMLSYARALGWCETWVEQLLFFFRHLFQISNPSCGILFAASLQEREPKIGWKRSIKSWSKVAVWVFIFICYTRWPVGHVGRLSSWRLVLQIAQGYYVGNI